ncbi:beta-galactosidase [Plebeiibacterium sediminum]|uniref:Beta-galactosidase n=1 Tax=Plebeiibacterium sediminum TaxID=2992112 RepID=A0AAE3M6N9_9BACT|nr:beta-galactosidase [Plebeiobacterium sediminum]MCW3788219.1 beta-galactosidase [Plebeiobacterium sediminum]
MKGILVILSFLLCGLFVNAQSKETFEIKNGDFVLNGQPYHVYSGEMHYARIPKAYWSHRLQMMKAMGLNTVATYVFWNYHETAPGQWDFTSDRKNLREFIKAADKEGMKVILRPGPYACAEWEFGGFPWRLLNDEDLEIRSGDKFVQECTTYINRLAEEVKDLQITHGGPIIMVQVENEFGSYMSQQKEVTEEQHRAYYHKIYDALKNAGFDVPFFTSDGSWLFQYGAIDGVLPTANGEGNVEQLKKLVNKYHNGEGPYMVAEFYPGWLDHWREPFIKISAEDIAAQTEEYLKNGVSFNFYMVHGGTNFGFSSGANFTDEVPIQPQLTSYDYDAPIAENGAATEKYMAIRNLMQKYQKVSLPEIPEAIPVVSLGKIKLTQSQSLFDWVKNIEPVKSNSPLTFEELLQGSGYVLYRKRFTQPINGTLKVPGLRDYATVFVNGKKVGTLNRMDKNFELDVKIPFNGSLDILVENMGRINYGSELPHNKKGIIEPVFINDYEITGNWQMYKLPMDKQPALDKDAQASSADLPTLYKGSFKVKKSGDTYLDMTEWGKGIVFVNGHNLGRYWSVGPQQTLYLPGCWLKKGVNDIVVFDQENPELRNYVESSEKPILEDLKE